MSSFSDVYVINWTKEKYSLLLDITCVFMYTANGPSLKNTIFRRRNSANKRYFYAEIFSITLQIVGYCAN